MTVALTRLNTALLFLEGKLEFLYNFWLYWGEGRKQTLLRLKDFYVEIQRFTY